MPRISNGTNSPRLALLYPQNFGRVNRVLLKRNAHLIPFFCSYPGGHKNLNYMCISFYKDLSFPLKKQLFKRYFKSIFLKFCIVICGTISRFGPPAILVWRINSLAYWTHDSQLAALLDQVLKITFSSLPIQISS